MKLLLSWLNEFIAVGDRSPETIAADLESLGHEVEAMTPLLLENVVVGEVIALAKHPDADRLHVAQVTIGDRTIQLIFGQYFPVKIGDRLPVAVAPCRLPTGLVVEARTIRGVQSDGMLAADGELGRQLTAEGILRFDATIKPGTSVAEIVDWQETVFDLSLTPNRGDAVSLRGIARELAAKWHLSVTLPSPHFSEIPNASVLATIHDPDLCPRYTARLISEVTINHAPTVIAGRLGMIGHGQYNSVVDVTNYVMEEFGVPLHAFDADQLTLPLVIRRATAGETIQLLDKKTYQLDDSMLVIADQTGPVALAGIMGGLRSAVTDQTTSILLEAAYFQPASIRRTRTKLNIVSDAAYRFERGIDPTALELASNRAANLINFDGQARVGNLEISGTIPTRVAIQFHAAQIDAYLGTTFGREKIAALLKRFEFDLKDEMVSVPSWRHDITIWQDLAEEVARLQGYDQLPQQSLPSWQMPSIPDDEHYLAIETLKDHLAGAGWTEHLGSSFLSHKDVQLLGLNDAQVIKLANPVSEEAAYLRSTQLISLLKVMAKNPIFTDLKIFEIGTVWSKIPTEASGKPGAEQHGGEQIAVSLIWAGRQSQTFPFATQQFGTPIEPKICEKFKIRRPVMFSEVPLQLFLEHLPSQPRPIMRPPSQPSFQTPSRFQPVLRDMAILVDQSIQPEEISQTLKDIPNLVDVELFDQFSGGKLPADKQSLAFHLLFEHPDRTLTDTEIAESIAKVEGLVIKQWSAVIR